MPPSVILILDAIAPLVPPFQFPGDDYNCGKLEEELASTFASRDAGVSSDVARLEGETERLAAEVARLKGEPSPLVALSARKADFLSDVDKFNKLIANLSSHKLTIARRLAERRTDAEGKAAELAGVRAEVASLGARVAGQAVNAIDVERMRAARAAAEEAHAAASSAKDAAERSLWEAEVQVARALEGLEATVRGYHGAADRLKIIPDSAKRAEGVVYEVRPRPRMERLRRCQAGWHSTASRPPSLLPPHFVGPSVSPLLQSAAKRAGRLSPCMHPRPAPAPSHPSSRGAALRACRPPRPRPPPPPVRLF